MIASIFSDPSSPSFLWIWEWVEFLSVIVIAAGCAGEVWSDHHKFSDDFASPRPVISSREKYRRNFGLLVVAGLIIETAAFTFSFLASNREIGALNQKAGDALVLAANIGTTNAQLVASNQANEARIEQVRSNNNVLSERLDASIKASLKLEMALRPRKIWKYEQFVEAMRKYAGMRFVVFCQSHANEEIREFSIDLAVCLVKSGLKNIPEKVKTAYGTDLNFSPTVLDDPSVNNAFSTPVLQYAGIMQRFLKGVNIESGSDEKRVMEAASTLKKQLGENSISASKMGLPKLTNTLIIDIGKRPEFPDNSIFDFW